MLVVAVVTIVLGFFLSGVFSGSETGFYRATRLRLVLEAARGDWFSRALVWLSNHPSLFVATVLVGNNLANYMVSAGVIGLTSIMVESVSGFWGVVGSILMTPMLFVYGELLPKTLFLQAPNRLLRGVSPIFLTCLVLFSPITTVLWAINRLTGWLVGIPTETLRPTIARRELQRIMEEGRVSGVLQPVQQLLAQKVFDVAGRPVRHVMKPLDWLPWVGAATTANGALEVADLQRAPLVLLGELPTKVVGYLTLAELRMAGGEERLSPRKPLLIPQSMTHLEALVELLREGEILAIVVDPVGKPLGLVTRDQLLAEILYEY